MDRAKYRGLRADGQGWVYGYYFENNGICSIFIAGKGSFIVIPETVCQYTGLKDKNGKEIYEGDKVIVTTSKGTYSELKQVCEVVFHEHAFQFKHENGRTSYIKTNTIFAEIEVIGNIHESEVLNG